MLLDQFGLPPKDFGDDLWEMLAKTVKPILVYGMGNGADKLTKRLSFIGKEPADFFASDDFVRGQCFHGKRVLSFAQAKERYEDFLILVSFGSKREEVLETVFSLSDRYEVYIPDMPLAGEEYFTGDFYRAHYEECLRVYGLLADEMSRRLFADLLWYKLTGKPLYLKRAWATGDEHALLSYENMRLAVDAGAYRGDTLKEMLENAPNLQTVYLLEPDEKNYKKLCEYALSVAKKELIPKKAAAWHENGVMCFASSGNRNATLGSKEEKIAASASFEYRATQVETVKIDDIVLGRTVDYIKYDTEGAEREALLGTEGTIASQSPYMRVSVYHKSEDIFSLPLWLHARMGERYRYYLRRVFCMPAWETELIAVPSARNQEKKGENNA